MSRGGKKSPSKWAVKNPKLKDDWWVKYVDPDVLTTELHPNAVFIKLREPFHEWEWNITPNPRQCAHFGCGKTLTLRESLFSDFCISHNPANYPS